MGHMRGQVLALVLLAFSAGAAGQDRPDPERVAAEAALASFTSPTLRRFSGDEEFRNYVAAVRSAEQARWAVAPARRVQLASARAQNEIQSDAAEPLCPEDDPLCLGAPAEDSGSDSILVTGTRVSGKNPSITNNQMRGVEEGDIVKQIDHYLLILQDGRIFVVDTRARGRRLALADRANVYRSADSDMWYDEMLVFGDRILVTGFSYDDEETELAVFRLGPNGRLSRQGVFRLSSNDYYSSNNYATRLIGDTLITYTPIDVSDLAGSNYRWPVVRRWRAGEERSDHDEEGRPRARGGRPLLDAASIYRPVRTSFDPTIHTVSVCPLGAAAERGELECRTTAVAGLSDVQWYVTGDDVYLWLTADGDEFYRRDECQEGARHAAEDALPALVYRVPVSGSAPAVLAARGAPPDQFAMQADDARFRALLRIEPASCEPEYFSSSRLSFFSVPLARFSATIADAEPGAFTSLPQVNGRFVASRFTERHLVYGGLSGYRRGLPEIDDDDSDDRQVRRIRAELRQPAYALAVARPAGVRPLAIRHSVIRAERVGDDILLTGYRDRGGLFVTLIGLGGPPRIASQVRLAGRYESEGRSHAFNSLVEPDGTALMGLPTVRRVGDSSRQYWRSRASDLSFLRLDEEGELAPIGELERRFEYAEDGGGDESGVPGYKCEVSCIDWYGNSRPIFTDGRIFGLSGTELIEGRLENGTIREVQRLNIALARPPG